MTAIDGPDLSRLLNELKAADKKAATAVRKGIRIAAKSAMDDVKRTIESAPGSGKAGTRRNIASGLAVRISTGKVAGVRIVASSKNLPESRKPMLRAFNKPSWRHPVFGNKDEKWVVQQGRPYFGEVIERRRPDIEAAVRKAMDEAHARLMAATTD